MSTAIEDTEGIQALDSLENGPNENSSLLNSDRLEEQRLIDDVLSEELEGRNTVQVAGMLSLLMIGVFISNGDGSIVIATSGAIASDFSQLEDAVWIMISYTLAMSATQPVLGKLSDVFGRKSILLVSYAIFAIGTFGSGMAQSVWQVVAGRSIAGVGGAGMSVIVSILITDLVPKTDIASWRSYVNVVATTGRSLGGPVGGVLADSIGWRWSFIGQVPFIGLAFLLVAFKLENPRSQPQDTTKAASKISRIDFLGAILIVSSIITFLLALELPAKGVLWFSRPVLGLLLSSGAISAIFFWWESKYATGPIFPPRLLFHRDVWTSYSIMGLQTAAQLSMMFSVPLYFQVTEGASNTVAGTHLVPAVLGNAIGGLASGVYIKKTGKYSRVTILACIFAMISYVLLIVRWHGQINIFESLEIFPSGLGTGMVAASTFIALTSRLQHKDMAVATSGMYLASSIGMVIGPSVSSGLQRAVLKSDLLEQLTGKDNQEIINRVLSDVWYVRELEGKVKEIVIESYFKSLDYSHGFSLICSGLAFLTSLVVHQHALKN